MKPPKRNRRVGRVRPAFTLVELLVVITIIGMLLALLMPVITAVQESARQAQCQSNQKQLCLALLAYEGSQKSFPGWQNTPSKSISGCTSISWVAMLLPRLDRNDLWKTINSAGFTGFAESIQSSYSLGLKLLVCPSDPLPSNQTNGESAYIANGLVLRDPTLTPPLPPLTIDYISGADGAANTLLLGENAQKAPYAAAAAGAADKAHTWYNMIKNGVSITGYFQNYQTFGFNVSASNYTSALGATRANAYAKFAEIYGSETSKYNGNPMTANIYSKHNGGSIVSFCDGHVQFLRNDAGMNFATDSDPAAKITVYQLLVTPDGSQFGGEPAADESQFSK
ncbi:MAG: DUF1559 domain-containing protein [Planctomycetota bacterium]